MGGPIESVIEALADLPPVLVYLVIGVGCLAENVVPIVPSDTMVLVGAFLAATGRANPWVVFFVTWLSNLAGAVGIYGVAHVYGRPFFATRLGQRLLHPGQLRTIGRFYTRWGTWAMFWSRFLPGVRAMAPVFAGVVHMGLRSILLPLGAATAIWYAMLVILGVMAGEHWAAIAAAFGRVGRTLLVVAVLVSLLVLAWWLRSRGRER